MILSVSGGDCGAGADWASATTAPLLCGEHDVVWVGVGWMTVPRPHTDLALLRRRWALLKRHQRDGVHPAVDLGNKEGGLGSCASRF